MSLADSFFAFACSKESTELVNSRADSIRVADESIYIMTLSPPLCWYHMCLPIRLKGKGASRPVRTFK